LCDLVQRNEVHMSDESETLQGIPAPEMPKKEPPPESQEATYVVQPEAAKSETDKLEEAAAAQTVAIPAHEIPLPDAATVEIVHKTAEPAKPPLPPEEAATVEIVHKAAEPTNPPLSPETAATVEIIHPKEPPPAQAAPAPEEAMTVEIAHRQPPVPAAEAMTIAVSHAEKVVPPMPQPKEAARVEAAPLKEPVRVTPVTPEVIESAEPPKKSKKTFWIILIVALLLLCCCAVIIILVVTSGAQIGGWFTDFLQENF